MGHRSIVVRSDPVMCSSSTTMCAPVIRARMRLTVAATLSHALHDEPHARRVGAPTRHGGLSDRAAVFARELALGIVPASLIPRPGDRLADHRERQALSQRRVAGHHTETASQIREIEVLISLA
jgi:hypothetical protein